MQKTLLQTSSACCLGKRSRGLLAPRPPTRGIAPGPFLRCRRLTFPNYFPHVAWENGKKAHGRNENVEKSRSGKYTFLPVFSHFPRMQSIRPAVFHRPARGRAPVAHPARKATILISEGVSACSCGAPNSQKHIRSLQKYVYMLLCFTGTLLATYRLPVPAPGQGAMPLVGVEGAKPLYGSPSTTGKLYERYSLLHPELGPGHCPGGGDKAPPWFPTQKRIVGGH